MSCKVIFEYFGGTSAHNIAVHMIIASASTESKKYNLYKLRRMR